MKKKLCLVTGACGFVGSHMIELLLDQGYQVRATDLVGSERGINYEVLKNKNVELIPSDLTKPETLIEVCKDVEYVFHIAALFAYEASFKKLHKVNVEGTRNLCEALVKYGRVEKFVNWSSGSAYGLPRKEYRYIKEGFHLNPSNNYGKSKMMQEQVVDEFLDYYNLPAVHIRCVPIYGPRNIYGLSNLWITYSKFPAIILPKNFDTGFPYIHVEDVCNAALFIAENERRLGEKFNVVDNPDYSTRDFFKMLSKMLGKKYIELPINYRVYTYFFSFVCFIIKVLTPILPLKIFKYLKETMPYSAVDYRFSNKKIKQLGYKFKYPNREDGIKETVEWFVKKGWIKDRTKSKAKSTLHLKKKIA